MGWIMNNLAHDATSLIVQSSSMPETFNCSALNMSIYIYIYIYIYIFYKSWCGEQLQNHTELLPNMRGGKQVERAVSSDIAIVARLVVCIFSGLLRN
jgi:hypothetical protein